jgi:hypothetical protein
MNQQKRGKSGSLRTLTPILLTRLDKTLLCSTLTHSALRCKTKSTKSAGKYNSVPQYLADKGTLAALSLGERLVFLLRVIHVDGRAERIQQLLERLDRVLLCTGTVTRLVSISSHKTTDMLHAKYRAKGML